VNKLYVRTWGAKNLPNVDATFHEEKLAGACPGRRPRVGRIQGPRTRV